MPRREPLPVPSLTVATPTAPAATDSASESATAPLAAPRPFSRLEELPEWLQEHLSARGLDASALAQGLRDPLGHWLLFEEDSAGAGCQVWLHDRDQDRHRRQPCPADLAAASDTARPFFNADATAIEWYRPDQDQPVSVPNRLLTAPAGGAGPSF